MKETKVVDKLIRRIRITDTHSLVKITYLLFGLPFLLVAAILAVTFSAQREMAIDPSLLCIIFFRALILFPVGGIIAGIIIVKRQETAYTPGFFLRGKAAVIYGICQIVFLTVIIAVMVVSFTNLET